MQADNPSHKSNYSSNPDKWINHWLDITTNRGASIPAQGHHDQIIRRQDVEPGFESGQTEIPSQHLAIGDRTLLNLWNTRMRTSQRQAHTPQESTDTHANTHEANLIRTENPYKTQRNVVQDQSAPPQKSALQQETLLKNPHSNLEHRAELDRQSPSKKYARRERHKTKKDKYEFKGAVVDKRLPANVRTTEFVAKRKRRKPGIVLHDEFRAPNVETSRLTLIPTTQRGLSHRGKSSAQMENRDLPDLTFSNMAFLSHLKRRDKYDTSNGTTKKARQSSVAQDIAAYFLAKSDVAVTELNSLNTDQGQQGNLAIQEIHPCRSNPSQVDNIEHGAISPNDKITHPELYTRKALIGHQPGVWRGSRRYHDDDSIQSLEDLRALARQLSEKEGCGLDLQKKDNSNIQELSRYRNTEHDIPTPVIAFRNVEHELQSRYSENGANRNARVPVIRSSSQYQGDHTSTLRTMFTPSSIDSQFPSNTSWSSLQSIEDCQSELHDDGTHKQKPKQLHSSMQLSAHLRAVDSPIKHASEDWQLNDPQSIRCDGHNDEDISHSGDMSSAPVQLHRQMHCGNDSDFIRRDNQSIPDMAQVLAQSSCTRTDPLVGNRGACFDSLHEKQRFQYYHHDCNRRTAKHTGSHDADGLSKHPIDFQPFLGFARPYRLY